MTLIHLAQVGEEVVLKNSGNIHQRVGVDPTARKDEIDIVAVTAQLLRYPRDFDTLLGYYIPDVLSYVRSLFTHHAAVYDTKKAWT